MKILVHTDEYYPTAQACSFRMQVFVDTFMKLGHEVTVITSSSNKDKGVPDCCSHKEKIIYVPSIKIRKKTVIMRMLNNLSFALASIGYSFGVGKCDVVITTSPPPLVSIPGWIIARCKRAMLVYDVRDIWPDVALEMGSFSEKSIFNRVFRFIANFMYKHSDLITTVSPGKVRKLKGYVSEMSGSRSKVFGAGKVKFIGNGFDESIEEYSFDQQTVDKYDLDNRFTCIYIGNVGLAQGLDVLLEIASKTKHRDVQFLIFGKGAEKEKLEKKAKEEGLTNVKFCGVLDHSKVSSVLQRAKLSFIPLKSSNMKDSVPTKIYEALGIGCPVLLYAEGDSNNILNETGLGRCVSPEHPEQLVEVFDDMVDHYDEIMTNREHAVSLMHDKYSRQKIAVRFEELLRQNMIGG